MWFAAHEAHGALVGQWLRADVDYVVAIGPFWTTEEQAALTGQFPDGVDPLWSSSTRPSRDTRAQAG